MVNIHERALASRLVRGLATGQVSPFAFEAEYPVDSADDGVRSIYRQLWLHLEEGETKPLSAGDLASPGFAELIRRCQLFLDSTVEYRWPPNAFDASWGLFFRSLFRLNAAAEHERERLLGKAKEVGDLEVWPFLTRKEFENTQVATMSQDSTP